MGHWRFYDFKVGGAAKHREKAHYIQQNPVRRGLVAGPEQWLWSSFVAYANRQPRMRAVNAANSVKLKVRNSLA